MKCPACGRRMLRKGTYFECSNILCDYEEDVDNQEVLTKPKGGFSKLIFNMSAREHLG